MGTTIGTAYVQILPSTEGISSNLTSALNGAAQTAGTTSGKTLGSSIAKGVGSAAVAIGTAAVGAVTSVVSMANETAKLGDNVDKMSQKLGLSAEKYQQWDYVLGQAGADIQSMSTGMKTLTNKIDDAKNGSAAAQEMFAKLGISMEDLNSMSREDAFEAVIFGFQGMADSTERAALANDMFGRSGQELTPLFNSTVEDTQALLQASKDFGFVMSDNAVKAAADYTDALDTMQRTLGGVKTSLVSEFLPSMTEVMNGVALLASGSTEGIEQISSGFDNFLSGLMEKIPTILETGGELVMQLAETILDNLPTIIEVGANVLMSLATGIADRLPELIPKCVQIILTIVNGLIQNLPQLVSAGLQLIVGLAKGLIQAIPELIRNAPQIIASLVTAIIQCLPEIVQAGWDLIRGLGQGIMNGFAALWESVKQAASNLISGVKRLFGIASPSKLFRDEIGMQLMAGMAEGITSGEGLVESALDDVSDIASTDIDVGVNSNAAAANRNSETGMLLDALKNMQFDFYMDGRKITDAITIRQRQAARSGGFA